MRGALSWRSVRRGLLATAALWLAGCGFHLQGRQPLPPVLAYAHLEARDTQSDFYHGLRAALRASGVQLLDEPGANTAIIRILDDGTAENVLAVSAQNVQTAYQLVYTVRIAVSAGGHELIPPEAHAVSREYSFDVSSMLAKQRERDTLGEALAGDLVTIVMHRLASLQ